METRIARKTWPKWNVQLTDASSRGHPMRRCIRCLKHRATLSLTPQLPAAGGALRIEYYRDNIQNFRHIAAPSSSCGIYEIRPRFIRKH